MAAPAPMNFTIAQGGFIGMGTSTPISRLHVEGDVFSSGTMTASNLVITGDYVFFNTVTSNSDPFIIRNEKQATAFTVAQVGAGISFPVAEFFDTTGGVAMRIANTGIVSIRSNVNVTGDVTCERIIGNASNVTGLAPSAKIDTTNASNITFGKLPAAQIPVQLFTHTFNGNVGIGTTRSIASTLDVRGSTVLASPPMIPPVPLTSLSTTVTGCGMALYDGIYTIQTSPGATGAVSAFDYNDNTIWRTDINYKPGYEPVSGGQSIEINQSVYAGDFLQITLPTATFMYSYTITRGSVLDNTPVSWDILGSFGGVNWVVLHSVRDNINWTSQTSQTFIVRLSASYTTFRMNVVKIASASSSPSRAIITGWYMNGDSYMFTGARITGDLNIGPTATTTRITMNNTGIGIGTTVPQNALHITSGNSIRVDELAGSSTRSLAVLANGTIAVFTSDARLKTNVTSLRYGVNDVMQLRPVEFNWKEGDAYGRGRDCGLLAQDVATVLPDIGIVDIAENGTYTLDYTKLIPVLIKSIQDLHNEVEDLRSKLR